MPPRRYLLSLALCVSSLAACTEEAVAVKGSTAGAAVKGADAGVGAGEPTVAVSARQGKDGYVEFEGEWQPAESRLEVRVAIGQFTDLFGIAGHLRYDPEVLQLLDLTPKDVPAGPSKVEFLPRTVAKESPVGRILLGGARVPKSVGMQYQPEGAKVNREIWLVAHFRVIKAGTTVLQFDPASVVARGPDGTDRPAEWGQLTVTAATVPEVK